MKVLVKENYRVIVRPVSGIARNSREEEQLCKMILQGIERHVDDIGDAYLEWDTREICSFCNRPWEVDSEDGMPVCCNRAYEEMRREEDE